MGAPLQTRPAQLRSRALFRALGTRYHFPWYPMAGPRWLRRAHGQTSSPCHLYIAELPLPHTQGERDGQSVYTHAVQGEHLSRHSHRHPHPHTLEPRDKNHVKDNVKDNVKDHVEDHAKDQVKDRVKDHAKDHVKDRVKDHVKDHGH